MCKIPNINRIKFTAKVYTTQRSPFPFFRLGVGNLPDSNLHLFPQHRMDPFAKINHIGIQPFSDDNGTHNNPFDFQRYKNYQEGSIVSKPNNECIETEQLYFKYKP